MIPGSSVSDPGVMYQPSRWRPVVPPPGKARSSESEVAALVWTLQAAGLEVAACLVWSLATVRLRVSQLLRSAVLPSSSGYLGRCLGDAQGAEAEVELTPE